MKKNYITPVSVIFEINVEDTILANSPDPGNAYLGGGGSNDRGDGYGHDAESAQRRGWSDYENF